MRKVLALPALLWPLAATSPALACVAAQLHCTIVVSVRLT